MTWTATERRCKLCNTVYPLSDFYKNAPSLGGRLRKCKYCMRAIVKKRGLTPKQKEARKKAGDRWKKRNKEAVQKSYKKWRAANKHKVRAENRANKARIRGAIKKSACERCGNTNTHAHHEDYRKHLDITWLCQKCHITRHIEIRADITAGNAEFWRERGITAPQFDTVDRADIGHKE